MERNFTVTFINFLKQIKALQQASLEGKYSVISISSTIFSSSLQCPATSICSESLVLYLCSVVHSSFSFWGEAHWSELHMQEGGSCSTVFVSCALAASFCVSQRTEDQGRPLDHSIWPVKTRSLHFAQVPFVDRGASAWLEQSSQRDTRAGSSTCCVSLLLAGWLCWFITLPKQTRLPELRTCLSRSAHPAGSLCYLSPQNFSFLILDVAWLHPFIDLSIDVLFDDCDFCVFWANIFLWSLHEYVSQMPSLYKCVFPWFPSLYSGLLLFLWHSLCVSYTVISALHLLFSCAYKHFQS